MENYDKSILRVLVEAGHRGLQLKKIVYHVYNAHTSLFETVDIDEVYRDVHNFIRRNRDKPGSVIRSTGKRGCYRLNMRSAKTKELLEQL